MKLKKMSLENFKGIKSAEFDFDCRNANIYGANGSGKTTVYDAFTWLLFGKASEERANFSPQTITAEGMAHNLDHGVECEIEIDGVVTTFRRVYHEVYKKVRGRAETVLSGHTTDYYINGVPKKEKEYQKYWQDIFENDEEIKLLTMPSYFAEQLHWEKRRAILLDICGNISDSEIMESDTELKELLSLVENNTVDEYKKILKAKKTSINKKLELIPARIDEATKAIPANLPTDSKEVMSKRAEGLRKSISEAEAERASIISGDESEARARKEIADINVKLSEARSNYAELRQAKSGAALENVVKIRKKLSDAEYELSVNTKAIGQAKQRLEEIVTRREEIIAAHRKKQAERSEIEAEQFDESSTVCDKCGQALPQDKVLTLKSSFNERKSNRLLELTEDMNALVEKGKKEASKEMLATVEAEIERCDKIIDENSGKVAELKSELEKATAAEEESELPPFETTKEYAQIMDILENLKVTKRPDTSDIDVKIADLRSAEAVINSSIAALETEAAQKARIAELEQEEMELSKEYEQAEHALFLCDKFTRTKAALLNDKINEHFKTVKFQLFKQNITNDGIDDICDVLVPTFSDAFVPFSDANKAARLNAGLEMIGVLGEYYGVELPIFVDNAESVTHIISTKGQLIRLIVSESDKELRLETL